jgi:hypothetical protein
MVNLRSDGSVIYTLVIEIVILQCCTTYIPALTLFRNFEGCTYLLWITQSQADAAWVGS